MENIVAKVESREISQEDVLKFLNDMGPEMAMKFQSPEGIKKVIDEMVYQELMLLDAKDSKLDEEKEFQDLMEITKNNLLKSYNFEKIIGDIDVSEEEVKTYYETFKDSFKTPEKVESSHILVDTIESANEILDKLKNGESFEKLAKEFSQCPSKESGGKLGSFERGKMVKEYDDVVFSLEEGGLSEPVKSQFGYHIIKLDKKIPERVQEFSEVKNIAAREALRIKQRNVYESRMNELMKKYKTEIFY